MRKVYKGFEGLKEMRKKILLAVFLTGISLFLDLYTKSLIIKNVDRSETITVVPGFLNIVHVKNKGIAFGILNVERHPLKPFIGILSFLALGIIIHLLVKNINKFFETAIFSVILGSALGNLGERFFRGEVTDFIDMHIGRYHWPSYNFADAFLTICIGLLILKSIIKK